MNSAELTGRLVRDPETKGSAVSFTLAVDRRGKDAGADFPRVVAFGKTAEIVAKNFKKGRLVEVQGKIRTGSYEGKNGKVYTTDVWADAVKVLDWNDQERHSYSAAANKIEEPTQEQFEAIDDDVPF